MHNISLYIPRFFESLRNQEGIVVEMIDRKITPGKENGTILNNGHNDRKSPNNEDFGVLSDVELYKIYFNEI
jgi:hypothetical protein